MFVHSLFCMWPLHYSCLENRMDGGAWCTAVHGLEKSQTWLSDFTSTLHFHALEKEMATHSSVLAWRTPGTGEPGGLLSMGSHRVRHDWSDLAAAEFDTLLFCQVTDWCQRRHFLKIKFTCACCSHRIKIAIPMHVFFIWCHRFMGNLNLCYSFGIRFNSMPALCIYF